MAYLLVLGRMKTKLVLGKMKNKIIITINNLEDKEKYQTLGINLFAYPLKEFCVGIPNTFAWDTLNKDSYAFLNRIMDNKAIDELKEILPKLNVKGIIFDDLGVLELVKDMAFEKILYLSHFNTNVLSIELYLKYVDYVIVSSDITKEETEYIVRCLKDKVFLNVLGYYPAMYSRRLLIDNYSKFHHIEKENPLVIENTQKKFMVYENEYGTVFYHLPLYNGLELMNLPAKYYFINSSFLTFEDIKKLLNNEYTEEYDTGFLYQETIYKLRGEEND